MIKQTISFYTVINDGIITRIGKSCIDTPKANIQNNGIKWLPDKIKEKM